VYDFVFSAKRRQFVVEHLDDLAIFNLAQPEHIGPAAAVHFLDHAGEIGELFLEPFGRPLLGRGGGEIFV